MAGVEGTLIAFAASDNQVASDNVAEVNGLFTKYLLQAFGTPGLGLVEVFRQAKQGVYSASNGRQNPAIYDNVIGDFVLNDPDLRLIQNAREIARLEAQLAELDRKRNDALIKQTEAEKRRAAERTADVEAGLAAERLQRQRLEDEAKRKTDLAAKLRRREEASKAEEQRVAELRVKIERERADLSRLTEPTMTIEAARERVKVLRTARVAAQTVIDKQQIADLVALDKTYEPLRSAAKKSLEKDMFETTAQFQGRQVKAAEEAKEIEDRYAGERRTIEDRHRLEAERVTAGERVEEADLRRRNYPAIGLKVDNFDYDADTQRFILRVGNNEYSGEMPPEAARRTYRALPNPALKQMFTETVSDTARELIVFDATTASEFKGSVTNRLNPKDGLGYRWVPSGTFRMGCSDGDLECSSDEKSPVTVTLTKGFWMGETEVTQEAYQRIVRTNPSSSRDDMQAPVESVTWEEARAYCDKLGMRLPTEAEWEWAARGGSTASRYGPIENIGWFFENSGERKHRVRQKEPNRFGLYDMLGNVREWTADWYSTKLVGGEDPQGPIRGHAKVHRGGSWFRGAIDARSSERNALPPTSDMEILGFRCVGAGDLVEAEAVSNNPMDVPTSDRSPGVQTSFDIEYLIMPNDHLDPSYLNVSSFGPYKMKFSGRLTITNAGIDLKRLAKDKLRNEFSCSCSAIQETESKFANAAGNSLIKTTGTIIAVTGVDMSEIAKAIRHMCPTR